MYQFGFGFDRLRPSRVSHKTANPTPIGGMLENSVDFIDFASTFTEVHGGTGSSIPFGGKLLLAGGATDFSDRIHFSNWITNLNIFKMTIEFTLDSYGIGLSLGVQPANPALANSSIALFQMPNSSNFGTMRVYRAGVLKDSSPLGSRIPLASIGDSMRIELSNLYGEFTMTFTNLTTSATETFVYDFDLIISNSSYNSGYFSLYQMDGAFTVDSINVESDSLKNNSWCCLGDSQTQGIAASTVPGSWFAQLVSASSSNFTLLATGGNTLEYTSMSLDEVNLVNSVNYLMMLGSNDLRQGASLAVTKIRYVAMVSHLKSLGSSVFHQTPVADNTLDLEPFANWIIATYGAIDTVIDIFTLTRNGAATTLLPAYDSGDGTHMNDTGQTAQYNKIITVIPQILL